MMPCCCVPTPESILANVLDSGGQDNLDVFKEIFPEGSGTPWGD